MICLFNNLAVWLICCVLILVENGIYFTQTGQRPAPEQVQIYRPNIISSDEPNWYSRLEELYGIFLSKRVRRPFGKSVAFLVGVGDYSHLPRLPFVSNDLQDMKKFLLGPGGFDIVYIVSDRAASRDLVEDYMMNRFSNEQSPECIGKEDRLLFYYSGHGADAPRGRTGYILFSEATTGDFAHHVLPINRTLEWSNVIPAKHIVFLFDACASGLAFSDRNATEDVKSLLVSALSGEGSRTVVTAGTGGQKTFEVHDAKGRKNGVFTRAFLDAAQGRQFGNTGVISIEQIFAELKVLVAQFVAREQSRSSRESPLTPKLWQLADYKGTFVFLNMTAQNPLSQDLHLGSLEWWPKGLGITVGESSRPEETMLRQLKRNELDYVLIPSGKFKMGCVPSNSKVEGRCRPNEEPRHEVHITKEFYIGRSEVTVGAFKRFAFSNGLEMPRAPYFDTEWQKEEHPMINAKWELAQEYCHWAGGRLPTEAEWEYAARGGRNDLVYPWGDVIGRENANYGKDTGRQTSPVKKFSENGYHLFDFGGNVSEWTADWYAEDYYQRSPQTDPKGPSKGMDRVVRGGAWTDAAQNLRSSSRRRFDPSQPYLDIGFRCVLEGATRPVASQ